MQRPLATSQKSATPGIIDTIAAGLSVALAHPLLMAVPMLLDLYYWIGWRLAPIALTDRLQEIVVDADPADRQQIIDSLHDAGGWDLTYLIAMFVPSMLGGLDRGALYEVWSRPAVTPDQWWLVCLVGFAMIVVAGGAFMAYAVPLADAAVGRARTVGQIARAVLAAWFRFLGLLVLLIGLVVLVGGPVLIATGIFLAMGINLAPLLGAIAFPLGIAAAIFLYFMFDAIVVLEVGPLRAVYYSFNVVRRNFWPTVGFIMAALVITLGLPEIWARLVDSPAGLFLAVIAHAFFAGGLAMASMIFFNDRLRLWRPDVAIQPTASS
ncbi:MAG: hypothetical protein ACRDJW_25890 [Thermomicrobiales bacterium]